MTESARGVLAMFGACTIWGLSAIYYRQLDHVPPLEVLAHRTLWSLIFFAGVLLPPECELLSLGVLPAHRRRGVAGELLRTAMQSCLDGGAQSMFLEVAIDNLSAQALYDRFGFVRVGTRPDYYARPDGTRMHAYTMRCDLVAALGSRAPQPR